MSEIVLRLATADDREQFLLMAADYLLELRSQGSEVQVTARTLAFWGMLFDAYTDTDNDSPTDGICGVIVLAGDHGDKGFSIGGNTGPSLIDTDFGNTAYGWGTYVRPSVRGNSIAGKLRTVLMNALRSRGFDTLTGGVHTNNENGHASLRKDPNYTVYQVCGYERLTEAEPTQEIR